MSWLNFWVNRSTFKITIISIVAGLVIRRATPARITLGVTTVLTITTLKTNADSNLPHTSYPKVKELTLALIIIH